MTQFTAPPLLTTQLTTPPLLTTYRSTATYYPIYNSTATHYPIKSFTATHYPINISTATHCIMTQKTIIKNFHIQQKTNSFFIMFILYHLQKKTIWFLPCIKKNQFGFVSCTKKNGFVMYTKNQYLLSWNAQMAVPTVFASELRYIVKSRVQKMPIGFLPCSKKPICFFTLYQKTRQKHKLVFTITKKIVAFFTHHLLTTQLTALPILTTQLTAPPLLISNWQLHRYSRQLHRYSHTQTEICHLRLPIQLVVSRERRICHSPIKSFLSSSESGYSFRQSSWDGFLPCSFLLANNFSMAYTGNIAVNGAIQKIKHNRLQNCQSIITLTSQRDCQSIITQPSIAMLSKSTPYEATVFPKKRKTKHSKRI